MIVAALAFMPVADAMASAEPGAVATASSSADVPSMDMAAMDMPSTDGQAMQGMAVPGAMPCCPKAGDEAPAPTSKPTCRWTTACTTQCIPAGPAINSDLTRPDCAATSFRSGNGPALVSLDRRPPPRPPRT